MILVWVVPIGFYIHNNQQEMQFNPCLFAGFALLLYLFNGWGAKMFGRVGIAHWREKH